MNDTRRVTLAGVVYQCIEGHWYRLDREYDVPSGTTRDRWTPVRDLMLVSALWESV
jgi:hypothetical protein